MSENNLLKSCAPHRLVTVFVLVFLALGLISSAGAQTETILHNFSGAGGEYPGGGLLLDATGEFYGITFEGGNPNYCKPYGCGVVYSLSPLNGRWQETVLRDLPNYADGSFGTLVSDPAGNLYGVTVSGGSSVTCPIGQTTGCGTVFELSPTATGQWKRTLLYAFTGGTDGGLPYAGLTIDASGNLYGTASGGVAHAVVFKLSPHFGMWTEKILHSFTGAPNDGANPFLGVLIFDDAGNIYGTAENGGSFGAGAVYEITP